MDFEKSMELNTLIGLLEEQEWALDCVPGGQMTHTAKKVYYNID